jgi:hypothetical protein
MSRFISAKNATVLPQIIAATLRNERHAEFQLEGSSPASSCRFEKIEASG